MGANSRQKGAGFERAVAKELFAQTGITFKRDLRQYQESDHGDLLADDPAWPSSTTFAELRPWPNASRGAMNESRKAGRDVSGLHGGAALECCPRPCVTNLQEVAKLNTDHTHTLIGRAGGELGSFTPPARIV